MQPTTESPATDLPQIKFQRITRVAFWISLFSIPCFFFAIALLFEVDSFDFGPKEEWANSPWLPVMEWLIFAGVFAPLAGFVCSVWYWYAMRSVEGESSLALILLVALPLQSLYLIALLCLALQPWTWNIDPSGGPAVPVAPATPQV